MATLHALACLRNHVVTQVVEAELAVGTVGDVSRIGRFLAIEPHAVLQAANAHAQTLVDPAHPLAVALGEVIVHGNDVDSPTCDGIEIRRERSNERLAFASLHLGDHAPVQGDATHDLLIEVTHPLRPLRSLPHGGEGLGEQLVEGLAPLITISEVRGYAMQFLVRHGFEALREGIDLLRESLELP